MKSKPHPFLAVLALLCGMPLTPLFSAPDASWLAGLDRALKAKDLASVLDPLFAQREITLRHQGQRRTFMLAADEFALKLAGRPTWADAQALLPLCPPGSQLVNVDGAHAVYRLPAKLKASDLAELSSRWATSAAKAIPQATRVRGISPVLLLASGGANKAAPQAGQPAAPARVDRVFVGTQLHLLRPQDAPALAASFFQEALQAAAEAPRTRSGRLQSFSFPSSFQALAAATQLGTKPALSTWEVELELSQLLELYTSNPNDPLFSSQWHLRDDSSTNINVQQVWGNGLTGAGVRISVVDTGIDLTHEDLLPNLPPLGGDITTSLHWDPLDNDNDPSALEDDENHGTACAGLAGAAFNNSRGVAGSAPGASLLGIRIFDALTGSLLDSKISTALGWNKADISSNSWGPSLQPSAPGLLTAAAIEDGVTTGRSGKGIIYLFASGNGDEDGDYNGYNGYTSNPYVITVAAVGPDGKKATYSERGPNITISAPTQGSSTGLASVTTDRTGADGYTSGNYTTDFNGTSAATPIVSGVVALMLEANPNLTWRDVKEILIRTATHNDPTDSTWATNGAGFRFSEKYGAGLVNAAAAVSLANSWTSLKLFQSVTVPAVLTTNATLREGLDPVLAVASFTDRTQNVRVESINISVDVTHTYNGDLKWILTSPSGKSVVLAEARADSSDDLNWTFTTNHFWGEPSMGTWTLSVQDVVRIDEGQLNSATLTFLGGRDPLVDRPIFSISASATAPESIGTLQLQVTRSGLINVPVTVNYNMIATTATEGADYTGSNGTLSFAAGETSKTISIPILNEDDLEPSESFLVILSNPTGGGALPEEQAVIQDPGQCLVTIPANDSLLARFENATYNMNEGQLMANIVLERVGSTHHMGYVHYTCEDITARKGVDYEVVGKRVIFLSGQTRAIIPVHVPRNTTINGPRTFRVWVTQPDGKTDTSVAAPNTVITIND